MWFINSPIKLTVDDISDLQHPTNHLAAALLKKFSLEAINFVIGESYNPDFRSPTVSQWALNLNRTTKPSFDINTGGISLAYLLRFLDSKKTGSILYFVSNCLNLPEFLNAAAGVVLSDSEGRFKVESVQIQKINLSNPIIPFVPCYGKASVQINANALSLVRNFIFSKIDENLYDDIIIPDYFNPDRERAMLPPQVDVLHKIAQTSGRKILVVELSSDNLVGFTELRSC
ncbi:MAG: hypothetical protein NZO16_05665 [Deltaproteobacteria bacterium]|nr:hypothetical protein [Deltaproteobacteria bacterium]